MPVMKTCLSFRAVFAPEPHLHAGVVSRKTLTKPYLTKTATSAHEAKNLAQTLPPEPTLRMRAEARHWVVLPSSRRCFSRASSFCSVLFEAPVAPARTRTYWGENQPGCLRWPVWEASTSFQSGRRLFAHLATRSVSSVGWGRSRQDKLAALASTLSGSCWPDVCGSHTGRK
jgi:hypothetical protein